jgi:Sec-independent protein secretion pathway component TatC
MIYTGLTEAFFTYIKVAFWAGTFITVPVRRAQVWLFIAPGLYRNEKQAFLPFSPPRRSCSSSAGRSSTTSSSRWRGASS